MANGAKERSSRSRPQIHSAPTEEKKEEFTETTTTSTSTANLDNDFDFDFDLDLETLTSTLLQRNSAHQR